MLSVIWATRQYFIWLALVSLFCFLMERLRPWRSEQRAFRTQFVQDMFWLVFNGHYAGILIAFVTGWLLEQGQQAIGMQPFSKLESVRLLTLQPFWAQFVIFLVLKDLLEWGVHNLLHGIPRLWEFHKLHHSILELDWIGNFRFHWMEIVVYKGLTYLPLVILGIDGNVILWVAVFGTLIGHLNHSNLRWQYGPLRYVVNSPRMHVWHHDVVLHGLHGQNFGIVFSVWDWLFGTAYMPEDEEQPERLGFEGMEAFPEGLPGRLVYPFWK